MPKAIRYQHNGQYLRNTMFWTQADYIGAVHAAPEVFDAALAAEEEALTIAAHKQDYGAAFGLPADEIEAVVIPWDGDSTTLPFASDSTAPKVQRPTPPVATTLTSEERLVVLEAAVRALKTAAIKG